jgi:hypothetical protein
MISVFKSRQQQESEAAIKRTMDRARRELAEKKAATTVPAGCKLDKIEYEAIVNMAAVQLKCRGWLDNWLVDFDYGYDVDGDYYYAARLGHRIFYWPGGDFRALMAFYAGRL